ncbi:hypothetical protein ONE63_002454 [Megalurothrips usitatus]|uniref:SH2 domain-containing protein n=1 Tax=Megalurothrips usitatus TaxID=439358 RepID=A0AAV7XCG9_9NEOP|nr:hypothetical protein ONE63_002454 [Megalurothrips usitatus]
MAYAAQLQRQDPATLSHGLSKPGSNINNNNILVNNNNNNNNNELRHWFLLLQAQQLISSRSAPPAPPPPAAPAGMSRVSKGLPLRSPAAPASAPPSASPARTVLNPCSPESDDSNSPTELNSYRRLGDKPPLIKRLAMGLTGRESVDEDADVAPLVAAGVVESPTNNNLVEDSPVGAAPTGPLGLGGFHAHLAALQGRSTLPDNVSKHADLSARLSQCSHAGSMDLSDLKGKRISQISSCSSGVSGAATHANPANTIATVATVHASASPARVGVGAGVGATPTPPPLPERTDSLVIRPEDGDLRAAPWFQAGIPREIALEVLGREPVGAFMVRESTTKVGCFALSLRVPRDFQPSGIAHYLILRTSKGYKIKGFTKEFSTLLALITHHSVMPELLPVPLALSRKHVNSSRTDSSRDFADVDNDPDYNTLADFRKIMADLNV